MKKFKLIFILMIISLSSYSQMYRYNAIFEDKKNDMTYYILWGGNYVHDGVEYACLCTYDEERPNHCQGVLINADYHDFSNPIKHTFSNDGKYIALLKEKEIDGILTPIRIDIYRLYRSELMKSFDLKEKNIKFVDKFKFNNFNMFTIKHSEGKINYIVE